MAPDGERIVYLNEAGSKILITNAEGYGPVDVFPIDWNLWDHFGTFEWAPDGNTVYVDGYQNDIVALSPNRSNAEGGAPWSLETVINWPGRQSDPAVSPNGVWLAFYSDTDPNGAPLSQPAIFATLISGSAPVQVTRPDQMAAVRPAWSPDSRSLVFSGEESSAGDFDLYTKPLFDGELRRLTNNSSPHDEIHPQWLYDGRIAYVHVRNEVAGEVDFRVMAVDGTADTRFAGPFATDGGQVIGPPSFQQTRALYDLTIDSQERADALLYRYAPALRYDDQESFRTVAADTMTAVYFGTEAEDSNSLRREDDTPLRYANPLLSQPPLSLDFLRPGIYPGGQPVMSTDRLAQHGDSADHARIEVAGFQESGPYRDRVYARARFDDGRWWLQYWFFYYYNPWLLGFGDHEGDWEMIQVALDSHGDPLYATYAQHGDAEADACAFGALRTSLGHYGNVAPRVYVAEGSHASYVRDGSYQGQGGMDDADGDGYVAYPRIIPLAGLEWPEWPGRWGESGSNSPLGLAAQELRWDTPAEFHNQAEECPAQAPSPRRVRGSTAVSDQVSARRPARLRLRVRRFPRSVRIRYRWPAKARNRPRVHGLKLSIVSRNPRYTPTGGYYRRADAQGKIRVALPHGPGPYTVIAQSLTRRMVRSAEVRRRFR